MFNFRSRRPLYLRPEANSRNCYCLISISQKRYPVGYPERGNGACTGPTANKRPRADIHNRVWSPLCLTYKIPIANTDMAPIFRLRGICRCQIAQTGTTKMPRSRRRLISPADKTPALLSMHFPATSGFHILSRGIHWNVNVKKQAMEYMIVAAIRPFSAHRTAPPDDRRGLKILLSWMQTKYLAAPMEGG